MSSGEPPFLDSFLRAPAELPPGEMKRAWKEAHLCLRCAHLAVCQVARAIQPELLQAVSSCLAYAEEA